MSLDIHVTKRVRKHIDAASLKRACAAALRHGRIRSAHVDILVVGDSAMRALNAKHLRHDYTTDVLSFHLGEGPKGELIGQIVVCNAVAEREARARDITLNEELARYVIHGTLHLLGHDDKKTAAREKMWVVQEKLVAHVTESASRRRS